MSRLIKAREVEGMFREFGPEKAAIICIVSIIEFQAAVNQQMNELTGTVDKLIDMVGSVAGGYKTLRDNVEKVREKIMPDER